MPNPSNAASPPPSAVVVEKAYEFTRWLMRRSETFPRSHRFQLGERIVGRSLDVLDGLSGAVWSKDKVRLLQQANCDINSLRLLLRLAFDLELLPKNSHEYAAKSLEEIGRMTGGWLKSARRGAE